MPWLASATSRRSFMSFLPGLLVRLKSGLRKNVAGIRAKRTRIPADHLAAVLVLDLHRRRRQGNRTVLIDVVVAKALRQEQRVARLDRDLVDRQRSRPEDSYGRSRRGR